LSRTASCLERLSAHLTEINVRLRLANDYLFKVDTASMAESLEVRVPLLDEDLFDFALSLPHHLKVKGKQCKRVLRAVAEKRLPKAVAHKSKQGFAIPVDTWVDANFKNRLREYLLASISPLSDAYNMDVYRPMVEAFCDGLPYPGVSRAGLYQRVIMLLAVQLALSSR
jgi:asparagine synthase (glutamine-hydrolysing)